MFGTFCQSTEVRAMNDFDKTVRQARRDLLTSRDLATLQVNVGLRCNQHCSHCHVDASPKRRELMSWRTMELVLGLARRARPRLVDITGGAPELNPRLGRFVTALRTDCHNVQVRTNLTVLLEPKLTGMMQFYKDAGVKLVASLPCYLEPEVDNVRGEGVFERSLEALRRLNAIGYGRDPRLVLDLVFNPEADFLPAPQAGLEKEYREVLGKKYGITFNGLLTITNMPVGRFGEMLRRDGRDESYGRLLRDNFNPQTLDKLMCLHQIDVGWDGTVYDCDFNLARGLPARLDDSSKKGAHVSRFDPERHTRRSIITTVHCFGCTAGAGSSCGGALEK